MKIAFIGGGNMGEAMLAAVIGQNLAAPGDIIVCDINEARLGYLQRKFNVATTTDNSQAVSKTDIVILAVKPQNLAEVMSELKGKLFREQVILSIIAGARVNAISSGLGTDRIVRAMPNTPAQIGLGMTVWMATPAVTEDQKKNARAILGAMGVQIAVADEKYLDAATAVSGSGPAYLFLFVECMVGAAVELGFTPEIAETLVTQTVLGSATLLKQSGKSPAELRRMVTSPGGTTAAAIQEFEKYGLAEIVKKAVRSAFNRAGELGK